MKQQTIPYLQTVSDWKPSFSWMSVRLGLALTPVEEEMVELEDWLDKAEEQLYSRVSQAGGEGVLAQDMVDLVAGLREEYTSKGFMKRSGRR